MNLSTPSGRLRFKLDLAYPALSAESEQIWSSPRVRELYPAYLGTMHTIVRSAVPLMGAALERARALAPNDPVAARLATYLAHHIDEEVGHDQWLLEDLEATGGNTQAPLLRIPSANAATLVGAQYYWLLHHHPVSLLGHMAVMEGYPPQPAFAERLREATGYPADAFRAVRRHARLDIRHQAELYEAIDGMGLSREQETLLGITGLHTIASAVEVFAEIRRGVTDGIASGVPV